MEINQIKDIIPFNRSISKLQKLVWLQLQQADNVRVLPPLHSLKDLTLTPTLKVLHLHVAIDNEDSQKHLLQILTRLPLLEVIELTRLENFSELTALELAETLIELPELTKLKLQLNSTIEASAVYRLLIQLLSVCMTDLCVCAPYSTDFSEEMVLEIGRSIKFASCIEIEGIYLPDESDYENVNDAFTELAESTSHIVLLKFLGIDYAEDDEESYCYEDYIEEKKRISTFLQASRLLAGFRKTKNTTLPNEVICIIVAFTLGSSSVCPDRIQTITTCLLDRRTLGQVQSEVVNFDMNVLYVRCKRALEQLDSP